MLQPSDNPVSVFVLYFKVNKGGADFRKSTWGIPFMLDWSDCWIWLLRERRVNQNQIRRSVCSMSSLRQDRDGNGKVSGTWEEELSSQRKDVISSSPEADLQRNKRGRENSSKLGGGNAQVFF